MTDPSHSTSKNKKSKKKEKKEEGSEASNPSKVDLLGALSGQSDLFSKIE
jgi:hypothetical protein